MDNKQIKKQRAELDSAWKAYCDASRHLQALNSRIRFIKRLHPDFQRDYYAPALARYVNTLQLLRDCTKLPEKACATAPDLV